MKQKSIKILLVEDDSKEALKILEMLSETKDINYYAEHIEDLTSSMQYLDSTDVDVVLLDLTLPDNKGLKALTTIHNYKSHLPIVALITSREEDTIKQKGVWEGAQDYLVKGQFDLKLLERTINYAIERQRMLVKLEEKIIELTKLGDM